jgi:hypothetical protein
MARRMGRKALSSNSPRLVNRNERAGPGLGTNLLFKNPEYRLARKLPTRLPKPRRIFGAYCFCANGLSPHLFLWGHE